MQYDSYTKDQSKGQLVLRLTYLDWFNIPTSQTFPFSCILLIWFCSPHYSFGEQQTHLKWKVSFHIICGLLRFHLESKKDSQTKKTGANKSVIISFLIQHNDLE